MFTYTAAEHGRQRAATVLRHHGRVGAATFIAAARPAIQGGTRLAPGATCRSKRERQAFKAEIKKSLAKNKT